MSSPKAISVSAGFLLSPLYTATAVLGLLQEVAQVQDAKIDWNLLAKRTSTGITNAREYQMLWRHLAYRDELADKVEDEVKPLAKILYKVPFLDDERQKIKSLIQSNLYLYISILLEGLKQFEEDYSIQIRKKLADQPSTSAAGSSVKNIEKNIYSLSTELQSFSDSLLQVVKSGNLEVVFPDVSYEYSVLVEKLWKDEGFLAMVAEYFLSRAIEISSMTYEPSDEDILYADGITSSNGLASMEYSVPSSPPVTFMDATEQNDAPMQRLVVIAMSTWMRISTIFEKNGQFMCRISFLGRNRIVN